MAAKKVKTENKAEGIKVSSADMAKAAGKEATEVSRVTGVEGVEGVENNATKAKPSAKAKTRTSTKSESDKSESHDVAVDSLEDNAVMAAAAKEEAKRAADAPNNAGRVFMQDNYYRLRKGSKTVYGRLASEENGKLRILVLDKKKRGSAAEEFVSEDYDIELVSYAEIEAELR